MSLTHRIRKKIRTCQRADWERYRVVAKGEYITIAWVKRQLELNNNHCQLCKTELLLTNWAPTCLQQFSIDRIDNKVRHIQANCQITCLGCNWKRR